MKAKKIKAEQIYYFIVDNAIAPVCFTQAHIEVCADSAFCDLYETKQDAEFALKFRDMKREEYLSLPFYEEAKKGICTKFYYKDIEYVLYIQGGIENQTIMVKSFTLTGGNILFNKPLTYENYIEACELVRNLWEGE